MIDLEAVPGIGPAIAKKLREAQITTAELLAVQDPETLNWATKIGEGNCQRLIGNARTLLPALRFKNGVAHRHIEESRPVLKLGLEKLDSYLMGGIPAGSIVELFGAARGGKTAWCHHIASRAMLPVSEGGLDSNVIWLSTENGFSSLLMIADCIRWNIPYEEGLRRIEEIELVDDLHLESIMGTVQSLLAKDEYRLLVIDNISALFDDQYSGYERSEVSLKALYRFMNTMRKVILCTNSIMVYTNRVHIKFSAFGKEENSPLGGHVLGHSCDYRFYVRRKLNDLRFISLKDNVQIPEFQLETALGWGGMYESNVEKKEHDTLVFDTLEREVMPTNRMIREIGGDPHLQEV